MPIARRASAGGRVYHVLKRANARRALLDTDDDKLFARVLVEAHERVAMR